ncbi:hypothetical protein [Roseobacter sp. MED193]|nr:hypothetical protein [Roseobacter sp. MED193]
MSAFRTFDYPFTLHNRFKGCFGDRHRGVLPLSERMVKLVVAH